MLIVNLMKNRFNKYRNIFIEKTLKKFSELIRFRLIQSEANDTKTKACSKKKYQTKHFLFKLDVIEYQKKFEFVEIEC